MTERATRKVTRIALAVLALAAFLSSPGHVRAQEQIEIRYAAMPILSQAPIIIAERKGLFAAQGIKVSLLRVQSGAQGLEAVMAGSADATHISDTPLIYAASNGLKIVAVADDGRITKQNTQSAIMVKSDSKIYTLADLKGTKIANLPPGTINDVQLKGLILPKLGLKAGTDVSIIVAGFPEMLGMLRAGTVDAAFEDEPFITTMLKRGGFRIISRLSEFIPENGNYLSMITFRRDFVLSHGDAVRRFLRAYLQGVAIYTNDKSERVAALSEWVKLPQDVLEDVPPIEIALDGKINVAALTPVVKTLLKLGDIKKPLDIRPYVDNSYLP